MKVKFNDFESEAKSHKKDIIQAIAKVVSSGRYILGKEVASFERDWAKFIGSKYCIGVGNGQEALQISLMSLGIGQGDEVITTPFSAVATTLAILAVGAKPVFVDTDQKGLINPDLTPLVITKKTKVILPVHLYGQPANLDKIKKICQNHHLSLVEDACQAHGSLYQKKSVGTFGDLGCFSFYPTKNLGAFGDGGAIVTNNHNLAKICHQIRDYGQSQKYIHHRFGLNSRLDEIQAAILKVKLKFLKSNNNRRRILAERYLKNLSSLPVEAIFSEGTNFHLFVVKVIKRQFLQNFLFKMGIQTFVHYPKIIPEQPFLNNLFDSHNLINAKLLASQVLSLPCNPQMSLEEVEYISGKVRDFYS